VYVQSSVQSLGFVNRIVTDSGTGGVDPSYATATVGRAVPAKCATTIGEPPLKVRVTWVSPFDAVPHL
jgi:hypothetical protein